MEAFTIPEKSPLMETFMIPEKSPADRTTSAPAVRVALRFLLLRPPPLSKLVRRPPPPSSLGLLALYPSPNPSRTKKNASFPGRSRRPLVPPGLLALYPPPRPLARSRLRPTRRALPMVCGCLLVQAALALLVRCACRGLSPLLRLPRPGFARTSLRGSGRLAR